MLNLITSTIYLYADDTKLFGRVDNHLDRKTLQKDLDQLSVWSQHEELRFHVDKCKIMRIGGSRNPHARYTIESVNLQTTDEEKDLGVWIDSAPLKSFQRH